MASTASPAGPTVLVCISLWSEQHLVSTKAGGLKSHNNHLGCCSMAAGVSLKTQMVWTVRQLHLPLAWPEEVKARTS